MQGGIQCPALANHNRWQPYDINTNKAISDWAFHWSFCSTRNYVRHTWGRYSWPHIIGEGFKAQEVKCSTIKDLADSDLTLKHHFHLIISSLLNPQFTLLKCCPHWLQLLFMPSHTWLVATNVYLSGGTTTFLQFNLSIRVSIGTSEVQCTPTFRFSHQVAKDCHTSNIQTMAMMWNCATDNGHECGISPISYESI